MTIRQQVKRFWKVFEMERKNLEKALLEMLDEERLKYVGSMVLGLNDALVELTGSLAGFTFAMQNTKLIALSGLIVYCSPLNIAPLIKGNTFVVVDTTFSALDTTVVPKLFLLIVAICLTSSKSLLLSFSRFVSPVLEIIDNLAPIMFLVPVAGLYLTLNNNLALKL